jgi:hypothetical protein
MAILKKGILGTPKGKIGNIMCYQRKGKGVIQCVPTVVDKMRRLQNLVKTPILDYIATLYPYYPSVYTDGWDSNAPAGMTGFEWYMEFNRLWLLDYPSSNATGLTVNWNAVYNFTPFSGYLDLATKILYLSLPASGNLSNGDRIQQMIIRMLLPDGSPTGITFYDVPLFKTDLEIDISASYHPDAVVMWFVGRNTSTNKSSQVIMADTLQVRT